MCQPQPRHDKPTYVPFFLAKLSVSAWPESRARKTENTGTADRDLFHLAWLIEGAREGDLRACSIEKKGGSNVTLRRLINLSPAPPRLREPLLSAVVRPPVPRRILFLVEFATCNPPTREHDKSERCGPTPDHPLPTFLPTFPSSSHEAVALQRALSARPYFGVVTTAQEAHAVLEASKLGLLPRCTRRLTDDERLRFVQPGAVFVWEEEEAGIRRWTDHIKWSPSRVTGAFLTYTEVPSRGDESLIKQSFSSVDSTGTKMHLIAYTSKSSFINGTLPTASRDPLIQRMLAQRSSGGRDPRESRGAPSLSRPPQPPMHAPATAHDPVWQQHMYTHPSHPPTAGFPRPPPAPTLPPFSSHASFDFHRSNSVSLERRRGRPRSSSAADQDRPQTSASEPRPSSSYDSHTSRSTSTSSVSFPSFPPHRPILPQSRPLSESSAASRPPLLPLVDSPKPGSIAYDASPASPSRYPPFFDSSEQKRSPTFSPPSTAPSTASTIPASSSFGPFSRHLPPLDDLPRPPTSVSECGESPPRYLMMQGTFLDDDERSGSRPGFSQRQTVRGSEDERQLRLLGRPL
ncbi:hypothetical protein JCM11641_005442 [Rhodosporidiobolus odoratus]